MITSKSDRSHLTDVLFADMQQDLDAVQQVKEDLEELREYVDRLEEHSHRRKLRLLEQVTSSSNKFYVFFMWHFF